MIRPDCRVRCLFTSLCRECEYPAVGGQLVDLRTTAPRVDPSASVADEVGAAVLEE